MTYQKTRYIFFILNFCSALIQATSIIIPRSQSVNAARNLVGVQQFMYPVLEEKNCTLRGFFAFTPEFQRNFKGARLVQCLFDGDIFLSESEKSSCSTPKNASLLIQGSCITGRNAKAWLADYFGLPRDFNSTVTFSPRIHNTIMDFNGYLALDTFAQGLFLNVHAPLVRTEWNLNASESAAATGNNVFEAGYMGVSGNAPNYGGVAPARHSFLTALDGSYTFGDMKTPLKYGIIGKNKNICKFSDITFELGYNFLLCDDYHIGLKLIGSFPAGTKPNGTYLFEPIIGNGKFGTLGAGLTTHVTLWSDCEYSDRNVALYVDANITHLFKSKQQRSFDLKDKPNSRYMLIEQFGAPTTANTPGGELFTQPVYQANAAAAPVGTQYNGSLLPLINVSTFNVEVSYPVQADVALKLAYVSPCWEIDLGYSFWCRSAEKMKLGSNTTFAEKTYALKGDAFVWGFGALNAHAQAGNPIRLSATQSKATIHHGTNIGVNGIACDTPAFDATARNPHVDTPVAAITNNPTFALGQDSIIIDANTNGDAANQQRTSAQPVFIASTDFDIPARGARTTTHKIFGHLSYNWECDNISPFLGLGGEGEFAPGRKINAACRDNLNNCGINQWGIWIKGGLNFN